MTVQEAKAKARALGREVARRRRAQIQAEVASKPSLIATAEQSYRRWEGQ